MSTDLKKEQAMETQVEQMKNAVKFIPEILTALALPENRARLYELWEGITEVKKDTLEFITDQAEELKMLGALAVELSVDIFVENDGSRGVRTDEYHELQEAIAEQVCD